MTTPELNTTASNSDVGADAVEKLIADNAAARKNYLHQQKKERFMHGLKSFGIGLGCAVAWIGACGAVCYVGARATARGYKAEGVDMNNMGPNLN